MGTLIRLDWGWEGAARAGRRGDVLVVVDTLRFSTAVATGVAHGLRLRPVTFDSTHTNKAYLSPLAIQTLPEGTALDLPSPNGATCCCKAEGAAAIYAGSLVNAAAVAAAVRQEGRPITVLACGERWQAPGEDGALRFAIEDFLGAGAVITALDGLSSSPDAKAARAAFLSARQQLLPRLLACESGVELVEKGREDDIHFAAQESVLAVAPKLAPDGFFSKNDNFNDRTAE